MNEDWVTKAGRWVLRVLVIVPAGCLFALCVGAIVASIEDAWWVVFATSPWWGFGIVLSVALVWMVWGETA